MAKRLFDIFFSIIGIVIIWPLLLYTAYKVKSTSPGPVFYKGIRVGKNGKLFRIFKFRTMVENAEQIGGPSTAGDDLRLTETGKWLKTRKLDELPQLFNVLKGEMSFVGSRPEVKQYVDLMTDKQRETILSVRPGMTDWASIWDFREEEALRGQPDPEKYYLENIRPMKLKLQMLYVQKRSFITDIKIILETLWRCIH